MRTTVFFPKKRPRKTFSFSFFGPILRPNAEQPSSWNLAAHFLFYLLDMRPHSYFLGTGNGKMAGNVGKGDKEEDRKLSGTPDKLGRNTIFFSLCPGFILWQLWSFKVISSRLKMALFQSLLDKKSRRVVWYFCYAWTWAMAFQKLSSVALERKLDEMRN